jgi:hypothetical protein
MPRYDFAFEATPQLGSAALKCLLWKRGGMAGPIALILLPILLLVLAWDPTWRTVAGVLGGAALMLLILFLLAVRHRRNVRNRFFLKAGSRAIRVVIDEEGVAVTSSLWETRLPWRMIERVWRCKDVALIFYQGWQYIAVPVHAVPEGALEYAETRSRETANSRGVSG